MYGAKKKIIGGREYHVLGSTIEREGIRVVFKSYTTTAGKVVVENGRVKHPDGTEVNRGLTPIMYTGEIRARRYPARYCVARGLVRLLSQ